MKEEKPRPDMTDQSVLESLLPIALDLLESDRQRGEVLWQIYKYLEKRFKDNKQETVSMGIEPENEIKADKIEFHNANVRIYLKTMQNNLVSF